MCTNLLDVDSANPLSYPGTPRQLYDVGACFLNNNGVGTPAPATFNDGGGDYPAYGVTTFLANYGTGVDAPGVKCSPSNRAPTAAAKATPSQACAGQPVTLDGTGSSDPDGDPLAYAWTEMNGKVPPSFSASPKYTFVAPDPGVVAETLNFTLTASDPCNLVNQTAVSVQLRPVNQAPVANAGPNQTVNTNTPVVLDGSASFDPDADPLAFNWMQTAGPAVALANSLTSHPTFTAPSVSGTLTFMLTVTDHPNSSLECGGSLSSPPATIQVTVASVPPTIAITSPAATIYTLDQKVATAYTCSESFPGDAITVCAGPVANGANFDTSSVGSKTFTVNATDSFSNSSSKSVNYTVGYGICPEYDSTQPVKSGAVIPIKLQLCDSTGTDKSSSAVVVHATGVVMVSTSTSQTLQAAGNANPDFDFRFDSTLGPTGGYVFNLKTTGYPTGTYNLQFTAGSDPTVHTTQFGVR